MNGEKSKIVSIKDLDYAVASLEATGDFRVLRRLNLKECISKDSGVRLRTGAFLDVETTGLDFDSDEVIELAIVQFQYDTVGRIVAVGPVLHQLNEPTCPISSEISAITGITEETVAGHRFDIGAIESFVADSDIIIAHNAVFDRPFAERLSSIFALKPWGCTMCDVPWKEEGIEGRRLADLLLEFKYFFDAHRAVEDCEAGIALLTMTLPRSGIRVFERLLEAARRPTGRIYAQGAPFDAKDVLRKRGYRWNSDRSIGPKSWWKDLDLSELEEENSFLRSHIFSSDVDLPILNITAYNRYSRRRS